MNSLIDYAIHIFGVTTGLLLGKLGNYPFVMNFNAYKKLNQTFQAKHSSYTPLVGQTQVLEKTSHSHVLTLNGVLVKQPVSSVDILQSYLEEGKVLRFTTNELDIEVKISSLRIVNSHHVKGGRVQVKQYNITLEETWTDKTIGSPMGTGSIWWF